jgi:hypothetical protein
VIPLLIEAVSELWPARPPICPLGLLGTRRRSYPIRDCLRCHISGRGKLARGPVFIPFLQVEHRTEQHPLSSPIFQPLRRPAAKAHGLFSRSQHRFDL